MTAIASNSGLNKWYSPQSHSGWLRIFVFGVFLAGCAIGALNIASAHNLVHPLLVAVSYAAAALLIFSTLLSASGNSYAQTLLRSGILITCVLTALAAVDLHHYASVANKPHPQTSQLALSMPAQAIQHGHNPYHVRLPENAPVSPGPGWIALVTPLVLLHAGAAIASVALAVAVFVLRQRDINAGGMLCVMMLLQPHFLSQGADGGDLYGIVLLVGSWTVLLFTENLSLSSLLLLACAGGALATARMALLPILLVPCFALARKSKSSGLLTGLIVVGVALTLDFACAWWSHAENDTFQPMHIFKRGDLALSGSMKTLALCLIVPAAIYLVRFMRGEVNHALLGTALVLAALFVPVGTGELVRSHFQLSWEGCNYISLPLPLLAMWLIQTRGREILGDGNVQTCPA